MSDDGLIEFPTAIQFSAELIRQLTHDLDGVLFTGDATAEDAFALLADEASAGAIRGAGLQMLVTASLAAHALLLSGQSEPELPAAEDVDAALATLVPAARVQHSALAAHASRLARTLSLAEQSREASALTMARSITRFYRALRDQEDVVAQRCLMELRSMTVNLDATAQALETAVFNPRRVMPPDRFHDWFMRYASLAQTHAGGAETAVATLSDGGRITAVITADTHPLEAADRSVREQIPGDAQYRDDALARIHALLDFIDDLRRRQRPLIGDAFADPAVYLSLVVAAATAPLDTAAGFRPRVLGQIARYNQTLLRGVQTDRVATRH